ncbi:MAG TPA: PQQ-dependent sugar dehydrogenase [Solirubrobacterales bacterium]|nr:PQQ-dependent sugar dehydrogenase [Solirubrobacterales bacterium]
MKSRKASRASTTAATLALLLALALPACGSASDTSSTSSTSPQRQGRAKGGVALKKIGSFDAPVFVAGAPGFPKLLFVVEQPGKIVVLRGGHKLRKPFLDLSDQVAYGGERGLLSVAFPLDYARSKRFYVYYTDSAGNIRIDEFKRGSAVRARPSSQRQVIVVPHPVNSNHNGGQLQFLGNLLYFGTGDGGSAGDPPNNAQNKDVLLGKLLRIDPRPSGGKPYTVPADNPFVGKPGRDEIYSYGLRNPFRFSFDRRRPRIAIADVGQNQFEELDYTTVAAARGANFGWDAFEGFSKYTDESSGTPDPGGTVKPILAYPHSRGGSCSIIGGYVVRDPRLKGLLGKYVYADLCEGQLRTLVPHLKRASDDRKPGLHVESPSSFGEDDQHRLYVASIEGPVYRFVSR